MAVARRESALPLWAALLFVALCEGVARADIAPAPIARVTEGPLPLLVLVVLAPIALAELLRRRWKLGVRVTVWSAIGVVLAQPVVFFALAFGLDLVSGAVVAVVLANLVEGAVLAIACRREVSLRRAALLALLMSVTGLLVGAGLIAAFFPTHYHRPYNPYFDRPPDPPSH